MTKNQVIFIYAVGIVIGLALLVGAEFLVNRALPDPPSSATGAATRQIGSPRS